MKCKVYKGSLREELFLYVPSDRDLKAAPENLVRSMGTLEFVMELDLAGRKSMARADPAEIIRQLDAEGFYVQLPPANPLLTPNYSG